MPHGDGLEPRMLTYFAMGALAGAITGVPIGPVNIAVIDTAYRHHLKRAIAVGLGGAMADLFYALVGILWFGPLVETRPQIPPILYGLSGVALIVYGIMMLRARPADPTHTTTEKSTEQPYFWSGFGLGAALILLNPSTLLIWVIGLGSFMAGVEQSQGIATALGIGVGSFLWFSFIGILAHRGKSFLQKKSSTISRVVGLFLIGLGLYSIGRAIHYYITHVL